jgi:hypothetical protein
VAGQARGTAWARQGRSGRRRPHTRTLTEAEKLPRQNIKREASFLKQPAHEFHGCSLVAQTLHKEVENLAFAVNRAPEPELPPRNRQRHLIEVPGRGWPPASTPKFSSKQRPELQNPSPRRFVEDIQTTLREQIFDVAIAEREAGVEPHGVLDDRRRKLMAGKRDRHTPSYPSNGGALTFLRQDPSY